MSNDFKAGDFLVFQLEAGYALLRLLEIEDSADGTIWHVSGYSDLFLDVETAELASAEPTRLVLNNPHIALTTRAFESTQVAKIANLPLVGAEVEGLKKWKDDPNRQVSDRSVRLMLGLR